MSATNRGAKRRDADFYPTPTWCTDLILDEVSRVYRREIRWLEPCRGDGAIYNLLPEGRRTWCELSEGRDYFTWGPTGVDAVITNPPFSLALEFLEKSLGEAPLVLYLLRLNFLGSQKRRDFWRRHPPTRIYPLARRPSFTSDGKTDATDYAWFCWDRCDWMIERPGVWVL